MSNSWRHIIQKWEKKSFCKDYPKKKRWVRTRWWIDSGGPWKFSSAGCYIGEKKFRAECDLSGSYGKKRTPRDEDNPPSQKVKPVFDRVMWLCFSFPSLDWGVSNSATWLYAKPGPIASECAAVRLNMRSSLGCGLSVPPQIWPKNCTFIECFVQEKLINSQAKERRAETDLLLGGPRSPQGGVPPCTPCTPSQYEILQLILYVLGKSSTAAHSANGSSLIWNIAGGWPISEEWRWMCAAHTKKYKKWIKWV